MSQEALFEVQTYFGYSGWENCWQEDDEPQYFVTEQEALDAISEFFADLHRAGMAYQYDKDEYRVVEVDNGGVNT